MTFTRSRSQDILLLSVSVSAIQRSPDAHTTLYELTYSSQSRQQLAYENTALGAACNLTYAGLITGH
ncbi:hypothetical protein BC629DRAFT_1523379 [Irpex lacteus]|nr:hypothetical protein BC629DRAFT_1523379 [Irpex lacteus]